MIKTPEALRRFARDGNRHYKGGGGGDGGAAARDAAEKARVAQAIKKINAVFGIGKYDPAPVDESAYMQDMPQQLGNKPFTVPSGFELRTVQTGNAVNPLNMQTGFNIPATQQTSVKRLFNRSAYNAAVAKAQAEADRKNGTAMSSRTNLYAKIGEDTKNNAMVDLDKDRSITERDLGFMLARAGLSGGSRDVDVNRDILDTYNQGVLKAASMGTETANNARSADDQTRVKLIQNIQAGLDEGQAAQQAYEGMANNARSAQDDASSATLKGFFDILNNQQKEAAYTQAYNQTVNPYAKNTNSYGGGANKTYGGTSRSFS